jgi:SAM-dependent methyltransferase
LPELNQDRARALAFGQVADLYDRSRPSYPGAAVDHILSLVDSPRAVVEAGAGTGKATALFAARGLAVTAIEPHPAMAAVAARNVPSATVVVAPFEEWEGAPGAADVVFSAQAWHWVDPALGVPKAASLLRPGGVFAVMANVPRDGGIDLRAELAPAYEAVVPGLIDSTGMLNWDGAMAPVDPALFDAVEPWSLDWDEWMDGARYVELMQSHSEYPLLAPDVLARLVDGVRAAVDRAGGVTLRYRTVVQAAIRRSARTPAAACSR